MNLLLVEDERKLSTLLKQLLEDERYAVDIAADGERAQELAETARYDAIILDLMIPKKDGMEVCRWLRQNRIQTPVIMLTARSQIHDRVAGLDAGADDYLPKPFAFEELLARLRALMRREQENGHANRLQVADFVLLVLILGFFDLIVYVTVSQSLQAKADNDLKHAVSQAAKEVVPSDTVSVNAQGLLDPSVADTFVRVLNNKDQEVSQPQPALIK